MDIQEQKPRVPTVLLSETNSGTIYFQGVCMLLYWLKSVFMSFTCVVGLYCKIL